MDSVTSRRRSAIAVLAVLLAAAGCQSGDGIGALQLGLSNKGSDEAQRAKISEAELRAYCPAVTLREGAAIVRSFAKGGDADPAKLQYQAAISDATRACTRSDSMLTMNVAVAGRVVTGPAGATGTVTLPIRVAVTRGEEVLYSQIHQYQVALSPSGATQFIFNDPNVVIPIPAPRTVQVFAGFDEGPAKKN
ncbi:MAG: hypothetical protein AB7I79_07765 [Rhizobiaceae bacterium]